MDFVVHAVLALLAIFAWRTYKQTALLVDGVLVHFNSRHYSHRYRRI